MNYYWFDPNGKIVMGALGSTAALAAASPLTQQYSLLETSEDVRTIDDYYISGTSIVQKPAQPSQHHEFDYATKQWFDARTLAQVRQRQSTTLRQAAFAAANANLTLQTVTFEVSRDIRADLAQELALAQAEGAGYSLAWERADGTAITLTGNQVKGLLRAISNRDQAIRATLRAKLAGVNAAQSIPAVEAVTWS